MSRLNARGDYMVRSQVTWRFGSRCPDTNMIRGQVEESVRQLVQHKLEVARRRAPEAAIRWAAGL